MAHEHQNIENYCKNDLSASKLLISTVLNFSITIAEIIGGLISNSLALISDALHNLGDTFAVFIAYIAHLISKRDYTDKKTFGYKRIEIIAALFNAVILIVIIVYLFFEAIKRIKDPEPVRGLIMFIVAIIGLLANLFSVILLRKESQKNINIKAAYLHLLGDTFSSITVIIGAVFIYFFQIYWIDPAITIFISLYLLKGTYSILKRAVDILMQGVPKDLDLNEVKITIEQLPEVDNIHHIHAWSLNDKEVHFEGHIDLIKNLKTSETEEIRNKIHGILMNKFHISHVTIQCEFNSCDNKNMIHTIKEL
jgi:cobalt-zinc-cadmium efflux system protein